MPTSTSDTLPTAAPLYDDPSNNPAAPADVPATFWSVQAFADDTNAFIRDNVASFARINDVSDSNLPPVFLTTRPQLRRSPYNNRARWLRPLLKTTAAPMDYWVAMHPVGLMSEAFLMVNTPTTAMGQALVLLLAPLLAKYDVMLPTYLRVLRRHQRSQRTRFTSFAPSEDFRPYWDDAHERLRAVLEKDKVRLEIMRYLKKLVPHQRGSLLWENCLEHGGAGLRDAAVRSHCVACMSRFHLAWNYVFFDDRTEVFIPAHNEPAAPSWPAPLDPQQDILLDASDGTFGVYTDGRGVRTVSLVDFMHGVSLMGGKLPYLSDPVLDRSLLHQLAPQARVALAKVLRTSTETATTRSFNLEQARRDRDKRLGRPVATGPLLPRLVRFQRVHLQQHPDGFFDCLKIKGKLYIVEPNPTYVPPASVRKNAYTRNGRYIYTYADLCEIMNYPHIPSWVPVMKLWHELHAAQALAEWSKRHRWYSTRRMAYLQGNLHRLGRCSPTEREWVRTFGITRKPGPLTPAEEQKIASGLPGRNHAFVLKILNDLGYEYAKIHGYRGFKKSGFYVKHNERHRLRWMREGIDCELGEGADGRDSFGESGEAAGDAGEGAAVRPEDPPFEG